MFLTFLTLIVALSISAVSAFFSVIGLGMIFSGSFYSVIVMGAVLEIGKLVTASWLYNNWKEANLALRSYLSIAVIILMSITSLGIFGYLSRAHVDQLSSNDENKAKIVRLDSEITRQKQTIAKSEQRIKQLETSGLGIDTSLQNQIDIEQKRIDSAYDRIKPSIDEQNKIIEAQTKIFTDQIAQIDKDLAQLQKYIDDKEIAKAQGMIGTKADGDFGPATAQAIKLYQNEKAQTKNSLIVKLEDINKNSTVSSARTEIQRLRKTVEEQVNESNKVIARLRAQTGKSSSEDIEKAIQDQQKILSTSNRELDALETEKFDLERQNRKLESEVGPIKYVANFIYDGDADKNILEKAVTWMILVIIVVFDPLAVLLLIAANNSLIKLPKKNKNSTLLDQWNEMIAEAEEAAKNESPKKEVIEKIVEKPVEVIKEVIKEVEKPIEVIKEVIKEVEKPVEVIKEIIKEVEKPVEVIKEVIKEVVKPVEIEKIIEKPIDRLVYISRWDDGRETYYYTIGQVGFGTTFPNESYKERYFIRTDIKPSKVFELIDGHWSQVNHSVLLTENIEVYTMWLIDMLNTGQIKPDQLADVELSAVENSLKKNK